MDEIQTNQVEAEEVIEVIPSMDEFKDELEASFHKIKENDMIKVTVIGVTEKEVIVDLGSYTEGIIPIDELSNDPTFSINNDVKAGDIFEAVVMNPDDNNGNVILSKKQADNILAWDLLKSDMQNKVKVTVKIKEAVNAGVICYYKGIRGFIPASQLSLNYVDNTEEWIGKEVIAVVTTVDQSKSKLVLSAKEVEREAITNQKKEQINRLQKDAVTTGIVDKIMPFGAFVTIGNGLSGLVHISQICEKRIKSPNEILKIGQEVTVKIIDIKDGKISLSMKAIQEEPEELEDEDSAPYTFSSGEEATTDLGTLLKNIKL